MFSTITTAPSMMRPKSIAPRLIRLPEMPKRIMPSMVNISESGIASATIKAARQLPSSSNRIRPPSRHLTQFGFVRQCGFDDFAVDFPLHDVERNLRLHLTRSGGFDVSLVAIPQRQRQEHAHADDALAVASAFFLNLRADC